MIIDPIALDPRTDAKLLTGSILPRAIAWVGYPPVDSKEWSAAGATR